MHTLATTTTTSRQYIHALWALQRMNKLSADDVNRALASPDSLIRLHAFRILAELPAGDHTRALAAKGLADANPHVKRAALDALAKAPSAPALESALALLQEAIGDFDTHLYYTGRLAL